MDASEMESKPTKQPTTQNWIQLAEFCGRDGGGTELEVRG